MDMRALQSYELFDLTYAAIESFCGGTLGRTNELVAEFTAWVENWQDLPLHAEMVGRPPLSPLVLMDDAKTRFANRFLCHRSTQLAFSATSSSSAASRTSRFGGIHGHIAKEACTEKSIRKMRLNSRNGLSSIPAIGQKSRAFEITKVRS